MPQTPQQLAALKELQNRRANLSPEKQAALDELSRRWGVSNAPVVPEHPFGWRPETQADKLSGIFQGVGQKFGEAAESFRGGDIASGIFQGGTAGLQAATLPLSVAAHGYSQIPVVGQPLVDAAEFIPKMIGGAAGMAQDVVSMLTGTEPPAGQKEFVQTVAPFLAGARAPGLPNVARNVRAGAATRQAKTATKIGSLLDVKGGLPEARRAGQFITDFGLPISKTAPKEGRFSPEIQSAGAKQARGITQKLSQEFNEKIIDPATVAGVEKLDAKPIIENAKKIYESAKEEFLPDRARLRRLEWQIKQLEESMASQGGELTPRQVQDFKVQNNKLLQDLYSKKSRGVLSEKQAARERILLDSNAQLRQWLESLDPQTAKINWAEGAGLDAAKAIDTFLERKMGKDPGLARGTGETAAVGGSVRHLGLLTATELMVYKPFRIAINRALNKVYGKISGTGSEFIQPGQVRPYTAPAASTATSIVRNAGGEFLGEQGGLVWFNDPKTKSTLAIKSGELTPEAIAKKLAESRKKFGL